MAAATAAVARPKKIKLQRQWTKRKKVAGRIGVGGEEYAAVLRYDDCTIAITPI